MTISESFAICPWCGWEDSSWPKYHASKVIQTKKIICNNCKRKYKAILRVSFIKIPVHESAKAQLGDYIEHPIIGFETRKLTHEDSEPK